MRKILIILIFLIAFAGCVSHKKLKPPYNVVLVSIDTLRADHLPFYGYPRATAPFLYEMAEEGVLFLNHYTTMPTTTPAHASMFTGKFPSQLSIWKNDHVLSRKHITAAQLLAKEGYWTGGFSAINTHFSKAHLDRGFELFFEPASTDRTLQYLPADRLVNEVISRLNLKILKRKNFFIFIHFYDPHAPYLPPPGFAEKVERESSITGPKFIRYLEERMGVSSSCGEQDLLRVNRAYDGEIRFVDSQLRRLFQYFEQKGLNKNTVWIFTSDHGEGLYCHRWLWHGKYLFQELVHVPLIIRFPDGSFRGLKIKALTQAVDLFPTVIALSGRRLHRKGRLATVQGLSLLPLITGEKEKLREFIVLERRIYEGLPDKLYVKTFGRVAYRTCDPVPYEKGKAFALLENNFKYIMKTDYPDELYDLRKDPLEKHNIISSMPARAASMKRKLEKILEKLRPEGKPASMSRKDLERLRSLGYIK